MSKIQKNALLIFAKAPVAGFAKTRLIPALGAEGAALLHQQLVLHTLHNLVNTTSWDTLLYTAGNQEHVFFQQCTQDYDIELFPQQGDDLGQRMFHAVDQSLQNHDKVCIVGTDCPVLSIDTIVATFTVLNEVDVVLSPAEDGGYVSIAVKSIDQRIFENIQWGTDQVMTHTLQNIERMNWKVKKLPTLWDVDVAEDLKRLQAFKNFNLKL